MEIYKNLENISSVCIVDENMLPACFFLCNHLEESYADRAFNTRYTYAKHLLFIYRYFTEKSVNLPDRVSSGKFITSEEYDAFKRHCKYKVEVNQDANNCNVIDFEHLSGKQLDNLIHATKSAESRVSAFTVKERLRLFIGYIEDLYNDFHFANNPPILISNNFSDLERKVKADIRSVKDENTDVRDPFHQSIPDDTFFRVLEIIKPASPNNPWTQKVRLRNQLIVDIFIETGVRKGALAKLKISDIRDDWDKPRLMITRTPNDPTDPRKNPAAQKTKAHAAAISRELLERLKLYIDTVRNESSKARDHDFILVSEKGKTKGEPIDLGSINKIIDVLSNAVGFHLNPHLFRHKWNEIFDQKATEAGFTPEQIEDMRKYQMGWVENSKMDTIYNEFKLALKVYELSTQRQKESVPTAKGKSNGDKK